MRMQTVAAMACMKSLLMVFNTLFWITGVVILAIGVWVEIELYKYMEMSTAFSHTTSYILIITGFIIILVGTLACCCTVKGKAKLLYAYGVFLALIFIVELGAGISIFTYRSKLTAGFDEGITQAMENYRNDSIHLAENFDLMQETLKCCGNHRPRDWLDMVPPQPIPVSCCIKNNCNTDRENEIFDQGCYTKIIEFLSDNVGTVAGVAVGIAFFPLVGTLLSCYLAKKIDKTKYEPME